MKDPYLKGVVAGLVIAFTALVASHGGHVVNVTPDDSAWCVSLHGS